MTDTNELDREKELSERFASHTHGSKDANDSNGTHSTNDADGANDSESTDDADDATRNRKQYVMYLPEELHQALNNRYSRYDGIAKIKTGDGIEKHKDFNEAIIRTALSNSDLDDNVGVSSDLDD